MASGMSKIPFVGMRMPGGRALTGDHNGRASSAHRIKTCFRFRGTMDANRAGGRVNSSCQLPRAAVSNRQRALSWTRTGGNRRTLFLHAISPEVLAGASRDFASRDIRSRGCGNSRAAWNGGCPERAEIRAPGSGLRLARSRPRVLGKSSRAVTSAAIRGGEDVTVIDKDNSSRLLV